MNWAGTYGKYYISAQRHIDAALAHVPKRRAVIQAGGHVGQFPVYLAKHFDSVYTWEPMPGDFRDLIHNLEEAGVSEKVFATRGMLGSKKAMGDMVDAGSGSSHRRIGQVGLCPIYRIDDIGLPDCDLIYLDVEGDEVDILMGASETISRCRPIIVTEERGKSPYPGGTEAYLKARDYRPIGKWMADVIWKFSK